MFSGWNVCRPDLDDEVDAAAAAAAGSLQRRRRPDKICLSPDAGGLRVNVNLDSDDDLRR